MTKRKPLGMSTNSWVDELVGRARKRGDFDNLPGKGKPQDLGTQHDPDWWIKNKMREEGIGYVPETIQIKRDVERFWQVMEKAPTEREMLRRLEILNARIRQVNREAKDGPVSTTSPVKPEEALERYRARRNARG